MAVESQSYLELFTLRDWPLSMAVNHCRKWQVIPWPYPGRNLTISLLRPYWLAYISSQSTGKLWVDWLRLVDADASLCTAAWVAWSWTTNESGWLHGSSESENILDTFPCLTWNCMVQLNADCDALCAHVNACMHVCERRGQQRSDTGGESDTGKYAVTELMSHWL